MTLPVTLPMRPAARPGAALQRTVRAATLAVLGLALVWPSALAPHAPGALDFQRTLAGPSLRYPFGTDGFGRCVLSRVIYGARPSIASAALVALGAVTIGLMVAVVATAGPPVPRSAAVRLTGLVIALPPIVIAIAAVGLAGPGTAPAVGALVLTGWASPARSLGVAIAQEYTAGHVQVSRSMGAREVWIARTHLVHGVLSQVVVLASHQFVSALLALSGLSVLGLGQQPPSPEWGAMLNEARQWFYASPWLLVAPGAALAIVATIAASTSDRFVLRLHPDR